MWIYSQRETTAFLSSFEACVFLYFLQIKLCTCNFSFPNKTALANWTGNVILNHRQQTEVNVLHLGFFCALYPVTWKLFVGHLQLDFFNKEPIGHFRVTLYFCFKTSLSYENEFHLHENEPVGGTQFHMNGFARRLVLTQRQKQLGNGLLVTPLIRFFFSWTSCVLLFFRPAPTYETAQTRQFYHGRTDTVRILKLLVLFP